MLARLRGRGIAVLAIAMAALALTGCGCTDDALPTCVITNPAVGPTPQLGGQLAPIPAAPGPGPIKPGQGYAPRALDVVFVLDDGVDAPTADAAWAFQFLADQLVWQLTVEMGRGVESDYDPAYGLSRYPTPDDGFAWPFAAVQTPLRPGGEHWDGVWSETVFDDVPALAGEAVWREGADRVVVYYTDRPIEELPELDEVDGVVILDPFAPDALPTALSDLGEALVALQESPTRRTQIAEEDILGYAYYQCIYSITYSNPELVVNPAAAPVIPIDETAAFYVSQSPDGTQQVIRVPIYPDDLEAPEPIPVRWRTTFQRATESTNAISANASFLMTFQLLPPELVPGGQNPTVDLGAGVVIPDNLQSSGSLLIELPAVPDPLNPPVNTCTLTAVNPLGLPVLFVDANRAALGGPYAEEGPYTDIDTPIPQPPAAPTIVAVAPAVGGLLGGDVVTITGSGFYDGIVSVTFDGDAATEIDVLSDTTLECTTPAHAAGTVDVGVTTTGGAATLAGGFEYTASP